jgi:predicted Zn-dependent protease
VDKDVTRYSIGIMEMSVEGKDVNQMHSNLENAIQLARETLAQVDMDIHLFRFTGPHLTPERGAYSPFDYLKIGINEKIERKINFLVIVTEVELAASGLSYVLGYSSRLTNISILSTKRLSPEFWGDPSDHAVTVKRLSALILHSIGHLLNLHHDDDPQNYLYDFALIEELDKMQRLKPDQVEMIQNNLPIEAHEEITYGSVTRFTLRQVYENFAYIFRSALQANPMHLMTRLPTMITTGFSVAIVLFFSAEIWDIAGTVDLYQLVLFSLIAVISATLLLYQAINFGPLLNRRHGIAESTIVTVTTILLSLLLTMLLLYLVFFILFYLAVITIFPVTLMETWPTVDPAVRTIDHIRLSIFLSGMAVLAGSLGGRADSRKVMRSILFLHEET